MIKISYSHLLDFPWLLMHARQTCYFFCWFCLLILHWPAEFVGCGYGKCFFAYLYIRGGVEDTRLEAKARDTKKIRGRAQPFRGQTLSRPSPRTKDTGVRWKVFSKKKVFKNFFSGEIQKNKNKTNKKRSSTTIFKRSPEKTVFKNFFQAVC